MVIENGLCIACFNNSASNSHLPTRLFYNAATGDEK
jgi:hypothetical protein